MSSFWTVRFLKPNTNRISVFCTSLIANTEQHIADSDVRGLVQTKTKQSWALFQILVFEISIWNTFCILYFIFHIFNNSNEVFCILVFKIPLFQFKVFWKYFLQNTCFKIPPSFPHRHTHATRTGIHKWHRTAVPISLLASPVIATLRNFSVHWNSVPLRTTKSNTCTNLWNAWKILQTVYITCKVTKTVRWVILFPHCCGQKKSWIC